jgi:hypothetical protein
MGKILRIPLVNERVTQSEKPPYTRKFFEALSVCCPPSSCTAWLVTSSFVFKVEPGKPATGL